MLSGDRMDYFIVFLRTIFFYFVIFVIYRIMGKREVGQLGIIDLIVSILIAELVVISIENYKDSVWYSWTDDESSGKIRKKDFFSGIYCGEKDCWI